MTEASFPGTGFVGDDLLQDESWGHGEGRRMHSGLFRFIMIWTLLNLCGRRRRPLEETVDMDSGTGGRGLLGVYS